MSTSQLIIDGLLTSYSDLGSGPTIVMLHGWGDQSNTFDALCSRLGDVRVVRIDLPGFGGSEVPHTAWGVSDYAQFVSHFISKFGITDYVLVGHSFGGRIAIKGVGTGLLKPTKLVLIASAGVAKRTSLRHTLYATLAKVGSGVVLVPPFSLFKDKLKRLLYQSAGSTDYLNAGPLKEIFKKVVGEYLGDDAASIRVPTLLVWGSNDQETPVTEARALNTLISKSVLEIIPDAGHFVHVDKPRDVARAINAFVA